MANQIPYGYLTGDNAAAVNGVPTNLVISAGDFDGVVDNATTNYDCVVTDNLGATTTSNVVSVQRQTQPNQPPTAVLSGTNLVAFNGTNTTLTCEATDAEGTVVRYVFKRDGIVIQDGAAKTCTNMPNNG